jgi:hypothetical protein
MGYGTGATTTRLTVINVSVFKINGTEYVTSLVNGSIEITTETIQNKAAQDIWAYPVASVKSWSMNGQIVGDTGNDAKAVMALAAAGTPVSFTATTGSAIHTGNGIITKCTHNIQDGQTYDVTIEGAGPLAET